MYICQGMNNWTKKIYQWKNSKKPIIYYIIIFSISCIIWLLIKWHVWIYFLVIPITTLPLLVLFIIDYKKLKTLKVELNNKSLKIKTRNEWEKQIDYKKIKIIYIFSWISQTLSEWDETRIIEKSWNTFFKIKNKQIHYINNLLDELYKKNIIICNIKIIDSYTTDIFDNKVICSMLTKNWMPYAIQRKISKHYRWVPDNKIKEFEEENNLIDPNKDLDKNQ